MTNQPPLFKPKTRHPKRKNSARAAPQDRRDLEVEITTLRRAIDSLSERIDEDGPLSEQLRLLDTLSSAAMRLSTLLKVQQGLGPSSEDYLAGLSRLLAEVNEQQSREGVHE
jgi:site-specific recombinase